jgi:hypothetical protein
MVAIRPNSRLFRTIDMGLLVSAESKLEPTKGRRREREREDVRGYSGSRVSVMVIHLPPLEMDLVRKKACSALIIRLRSRFLDRGGQVAHKVNLSNTKKCLHYDATSGPKNIQM